jgi:alpha-beta hydrolase superfamily lysophospholipase
MVPSAPDAAFAEDAAEDAIVFGGDVRLVGIVTTPTETRAAGDRTGVILLNAGVVHRVGPNRLYVTLARRLAQAGLTVLRFDHSGIGDSETRDDHLDFNQSSVAEAIAAMDWLAAERQCRSFVLLGLCSGTLTAFKTALADRRVSGLILLTALLVDPATVPEDVIATASERRIARSYLVEKVASGRAWRKALGGKADYRRIWRAVQRLVRGRSEPAPVVPGSEALVGELQQLVERGVAVRFIYADPTTVLEWFRMTVEPHLPRLRARGRIDVTILKHADHTFTERRHQAQIVHLVSGWLG